MGQFKDKKILLFAPKFFGYEIEIKNKLIALGAQVDFYDERPKNDFITKASVRINKNIIKRKITAYYNNILTKTAAVKYDIVFIINIEAMLPAVLINLKGQQPQARFVLYMWDSLQNKKYTPEILPYFNKVLSFDRTDTTKIPGVIFRPLFYLDKYTDTSFQQTEQDIDICFIGTVHSDRYNLVSTIKQQAQDLSLKSFFFMYFPSKLLFFYKKLRDIKFYAAKFKEFQFKPFSQDQTISHIRRSKVILDIQHPLQTGLTMRTIEMLGANRKIITTNPHISDYDFYNQENILIIDRNDPKIDLRFFQSPYREIEAHIRYKYSIEGWLTEILA